MFINRECYCYHGKGEGRFVKNAYGEGTNVGKANGRHSKTTTDATGSILQDVWRPATPGKKILSFYRTNYRKQYFIKIKDKIK